MKLYNLNHSPYATRVRTLIRKAKLDVDVLEPEEAVRTEAFIQHFPLGKIPVLELDDGSQLPDSWVIMEYLDSVSAQPLTPMGKLERAHMQLLARYADTYLGPSALFPLFQRVTLPGGTEGAHEELAALDTELARMERLLTMLPDFRGRPVDLGDIALVPHMDFVVMLAPLFGKADPLATFPLVRGWHEWVMTDEAVAASSAEMREAVAGFFGG
jgi:glutathione S-transferase